MPSSDVSCAAAGVEARAEYRTHRSMAGSNTTVRTRSTTVHEKFKLDARNALTPLVTGRNTRRPSGRARRAPPPDRPQTNSAFHPEVSAWLLFACVRRRSCSPVSPPSSPRERSLPSGRSRSTNGGGARARHARRRTRRHRRRALTFGARTSVDHAAETGEHAGAAAPLEPRGHRFVRPRSCAGRRGCAAHVRPPARARPIEPRDGHRPRRGLRGRQRDRSPLRELPGRAGDRIGRVDGRGASPRPRTIRWSRCFPRRRRSATSCWRPTWPRCRTAPPRGTACCSAARSPPASC